MKNTRSLIMLLSLGLALTACSASSDTSSGPDAGGTGSFGSGERWRRGAIARRLVPRVGPPPPRRGRHGHSDRRLARGWPPAVLFPGQRRLDGRSPHWWSVGLGW
jgi:hypothetical protein